MFSVVNAYALSSSTEYRSTRSANGRDRLINIEFFQIDGRPKRVVFNIVHATVNRYFHGFFF